VPQRPFGLCDGVGTTRFALGFGDIPALHLRDDSDGGLPAGFARGRDRGVGIVSGRGGGGVEIGQGIRCSDLGDGNVSGSGYGSKVYGCLGQFVILWESGEVTPCTT
jgi:hypothetical protein